MKKILMMTTAIAGFAMLSAPASAAIDLDLGGHFRGYFVHADNNLVDDAATPAVNESAVYEKGFRRDTELHVSGETTLDNGLTVGAHMELTVANGDTTFTTDEAYAYFSGAWGRVNYGREDGVAYLLQVAAPSADANVDGIAPTINGVDLGTFGGSTALRAGLDYKQAESKADRLTYMTPKFNGFQAGMSYAIEDATAPQSAVMSADNTPAAKEDMYEASVRYDGEYQGFAFNLGAGYGKSDIAAPVVNVAPGAAATDLSAYEASEGLKSYNFGANVMFQNFSLGGSYLVAETEFTADTDTGAPELVKADLERKTYVIGAAYDNGPYHVGVSYLDQKTTRDAVNSDDSGATSRSIRGAEKNVDRLTLGGGYSFGPGITFRGSVAWGEVETKAIAATALTNGGTIINGMTGDVFAKRDFTQVTIGTDVKF